MAKSGPMDIFGPGKRDIVVICLEVTLELFRRVSTK